MSISSVWGTTFGGLQKIGKALMLPVSVLPVAGILLGVGASIAREAGTPWVAEIGRVMPATGDAMLPEQSMINASAPAGSLRSCGGSMSTGSALEVSLSFHPPAPKL